MFNNFFVVYYIIKGCSCSWNFNGWRCSFDGSTEVLSCNRKDCEYLSSLRWDRIVDFCNNYFKSKVIFICGQSKNHCADYIHQN